MNSKYILPILVLLVLSIGAVSAKTLVAGKIYESDHITPIPDANINVLCDSNSLNTISLSDGTYAVVFDADSCSAVDVTSDVNNSIIMKVVMFIPNEQPTNNDDSSGGGSSGGSYGGTFYLCGNGICNTGETANTCPEDCLIETEDSQESKELKEEILPEEEQNFVSKITGAVTGMFGTTQNKVAIIASLSIIGIVAVALVFNKKKKAKQQLL